MTLIFLLLAWALGIISARHLAPPDEWLWVTAAAALTGTLVAARSGKGMRPWLALTALLLGAGRYALSESTITAGQLAYHNDQGWVTIQGHIVAEPLVRATYTQVRLEATHLEVGGALIPVQGRALANVPHYPPLSYGDRVVVTGLLQTPPELPGFSYRTYLADQGLNSYMPRATAKVLGPAPGTGALRALYRAKAHVVGRLLAIWPNPEAGLLAGVLLGLDHALPADLAEAFRRSGLTHILVVSGYNVMFVMQIALLSAHLLRRWYALMTSIVLILLYGLLVGFSPPVLRAVVMGFLFCLAPLFGRKTHAPTSLAFATLISTLANPRVLWNVSFQLSFAATLGLVCMEPVLAQRLLTWADRRTKPERARRWAQLIADVVLVTVVAQAVTLPITWHHFGELSLVSLLANLLVLPAQSLVTVGGGLSLALGLVWLPLGRLAMWPVYPLARYTTWAIERLGSLPWASRGVEPLGLAGVVALYAGLVTLIVVLRVRPLSIRLPGGPAALPAPGAPPSVSGPERRRTLLPMAALLLAVTLVWTAAAALPDGRLHIWFFDVGQGDAALLRTPGGRYIVVDGGPDPLLFTSRLGRHLPFWQRRIDMVVLTHSDSDHLSGLLPVLERYDVGLLLLPPAVTPSPLVARWSALVADEGALCVTAEDGIEIWFGDGLRIEVLHPPSGAGTSRLFDPNRHSTVLHIEAGDLTLLMAADIDADIERTLTSTHSSLRAQVLKVAHHGSRTSTSAAFLEAVSPQVAIISAGTDNTFGHPHAEALERLDALGVHVYRTDRHGTVALAYDGTRLAVRGERMVGD